MRTRVLALILAFWGVLTLAGCAGKKSGPEREGILTGVFGATEMKTMLDEIGMPAVNGVPAEIAEIVEEEISVFLGGASSAEDCAKKIQSRAGIWLSEHQ